MKGEFVCVVCPTSCVVNAEWDETGLLSIDRAQCKLAWDYISGEILDPRRTVTTTVLVQDGDLPLVSVKTDRPVPKELVIDVMEELADVVVVAPIEIGEVIVPDVLGTDSAIVATRKIARRGR
jgi:CxxC motif-containing protein